MCKTKTFFLILLFSLVLSGCAIKPPSVEPQAEDYIAGGGTNNQAKTMPTPEVKVTQATLQTNYGNIVIAFYPESPNTIANFVKLAESGFYNGVKFHRVIKDFMAQTGDPNSKDDDWSNDGTGGPGYAFADEFNKHQLVRGSVAMANAGPNTNGSQFFIVTAQSTPWLDGKHTNFGYVAQGMDVLDKINVVKTDKNDHPLEDITINSITLK
jgi:cyclophilin family peptidyl-prolyl cis-trans isomerase